MDQFEKMRVWFDYDTGKYYMIDEKSGVQYNCTKDG